jgi:hypothetical protein
MIGTILALAGGGLGTFAQYQQQRVAASTAKRDAKILAAQAPAKDKALIYGLIAGVAAAAVLRLIVD